MDKLASIRAFTKVVEHGSFAEAARALRLSRSAVSKQVSELERELGVRLLNRTTRSAGVTELGHGYYERCLAVLADLDEADRTVALLQSEPSGLLRVNAPMSFGTLHLGSAIGAFMQRHRGLRVQLTLGDHLLDPVQEGFDITLRIADLPSSSLIARKIVAVPAAVCAAPSYLDARGEPQHPRELRRHDCLTYGHLASGNQWKLSGPDGEHAVQIAWRMCCNNGEALREAAVAGCGIVMLPTFIVGPELQRGALRRILTAYATAPLALYAIYAPTRQLSVKARLFIDFLVAHFNDGYRQ